MSRISQDWPLKKTCSASSLKLRDAKWLQKYRAVEKNCEHYDCRCDYKRFDREYFRRGTIFNVAISAAAWILVQLNQWLTPLNNHWLMVGSHTWSFYNLHGMCTICFKKCLRSCCESAGVVFFVSCQFTPIKRKYTLIFEKNLLTQS